MMEYPPHLLQSPGWEKFRKQWGTKVIKVKDAQFTLHPIPFLGKNIGYMPRPFPQDIDWELLKQKAQSENCVFIKIEPNSESFNPPKNQLVKRGERMFAYATYVIDLQKDEQTLLKAMHHKTRYNIGLAKRKEVSIQIGDTQKMLDEFLQLFHETAKRHGIVLHPDNYYKTIFSVFLETNDAKIITGYFEDKPLASMMLIKYKGDLFYPYGGSTHIHKDKMAFTLVFWEAIRFGKQNNLHYFDLWNCLTPEEESPSHPWYGFHHFKKGFGGELIKFAGAYDVVFEPGLYQLVIFLNKVRWIVLKTLVFLKKIINR